MVALEVCHAVDVPKTDLQPKVAAVNVQLVQSAAATPAPMRALSVDGQGRAKGRPCVLRRATVDQVESC